MSEPHRAPKNAPIDLPLAPLVLSPINATEWLIAKTTHTLTGATGFRTQVEMETSISAHGAEE